jgi:membrane protease YdiL (CAAX protease family)
VTFFQAINNIFWNSHEKRLRALWRLSLHTGILLTLTTLIGTGLMILMIALSPALGIDLPSMIASGDVMQIAQIPWLGTVFIPGATFLSILVATFISGRLFDRRKFSEFGLKLSRQWWRELGFGMALGAVLMSMIFLFGLLTNNLRVTGFFQTPNDNVSFFSGIIQTLILFIFVGIYEEILSRGYHLINLAEGFNLKIIGKKWALAIAILISSLVFGVLHLANPNASWVSALNISLAGMIFGLGMVLTGRLAIPIGLHITWNFFQGGVYGFSVSGLQSGAALIATEPAGPEWLTGGLFGPEAGLVGVAAIIIGGLLMILWVRRRGALSIKTDLAVYKKDIDVEVGV